MPAEVSVKSILNKTKRRDPWFLDDYTINPYSGCSFNCLYCYIRGSKYGEHMEEKLSVKSNAPDLLEKQLKNRARKGQYGIIVLSSATDPYLQIEKDYQLTRRILEVILHHRFPLHIITKSDLVVRDFDLFEQINANAILPADLEGILEQKVLITFSFSTTDNGIAKIFEPGSTPPSKRLETVTKALAAGFYSGISLMPLLPYITDTPDHLNTMFKTFCDIGVKYLFSSGLTLFGNGPHDSKSLVFAAVKKHYPELLDQYHKLFSYGFRLPAWYGDSLYRRTSELSRQYNLKTSIIP